MAVNVLKPVTSRDEFNQLSLGSRIYRIDAGVSADDVCAILHRAGYLAVNADGVNVYLLGVSKDGRGRYVRANART